MAIPECKIGTTKVLFWLGQPPQFLRQEIVADQRPGVDGTELTRIGTRGVPFQLGSQVDVHDIDDGWTVFHSYLDLINGDPLPLMWYDRQSVVSGFKVQVLDVRMVRLHTITNAIGGLNPPSGAFLECVWDLLAIAT